MLDLRCVFVAPAFAVFVLRQYCLAPRSKPSAFSKDTTPTLWPLRFLKVGAVVLAVIATSLAVSKRSLVAELYRIVQTACHSNGSPNVWFLYESFLDLVNAAGLSHWRLPAPTWQFVSSLAPIWLAVRSFFALCLLFSLSRCH
jgi:hypothetical protein